jgi:heme/copper-type cytochrome/quinol oxidase subunit 3
MWLVLASLTMLFAAGMLGYAIIRLTSSTIPEDFTLRLPRTLWVSTALVLSASVTIHRALRAIQHEKRAELRRWLWTTLALAAGFIAVQIPSMIAMLASHRRLIETRMPLYGLIFFLVLVHAAHVLGGVIALVAVLRKALRDGYDHEHYTGVYHSALYWHFLDIVWLVMFGTMLALG